MIYRSTDVLRYSLEDIGKHPTLKLKKGTYTIEQIQSSGGCEIMPPITITVDGDMVIDYHTKLNGYIVRGFLASNPEPSFLISEKEFNNDWSLIYTATGKFETFKSTTQVYDLSDYSLQVEQTIKTAGSGGGIPIDDGKHLESYKANSMWTVIYNNLHLYEINSTICYPKSLSEDAILNIYSSSYWSKLGSGLGTDPTNNKINYNSNFHLYFHLDKRNSSTPFNVNELPDISKAEKIISSKTPDEWIKVVEHTVYLTEQINDYYNIRVSDCRHFSEITKNYITPEGKSGNCFDDILYFEEGSSVNLVDSFSKNEFADIEKYKKCHQYARRYDVYEKNEEKLIFKNYTTYYSDELKYADDWDEEKFNSVLEQIVDNMFNEQL